MSRSSTFPNRLCPSSFPRIRLAVCTTYHARAMPLSPVSDSIRFRLTPSLEAFEDGQDLLLPNGLPWQIMVNHIAFDGNRKRPRYMALCKKLLEDGLLNQDTISHIAHVHPAHTRFPSYRTLFALDDPFALEPGKDIALVVVGRGGAREFNFPLPGYEWPFPRKRIRTVFVDAYYSRFVNFRGVS